MNPVRESRQSLAHARAEGVKLTTQIVLREWMEHTSHE